MTARHLVGWLNERSLWLVIGFTLIPILTLATRFLHGSGNGGRSPWKYVYAVLVYAVCFPGICSAVLTAYAIFFPGENLMDVNLAVYLLPIVSMAVTLLLIRGAASFDDIPGFDRLSGLMTTIAITFALVLAIYKSRILLVFFGSLPMLIALVAGLFALLKWGTQMLFRGKDEPKPEPPAFPPLPPI